MRGGDGSFELSERSRSGRSGEMAGAMKKCLICWEKKAKEQFQSLPCGHTFCEQCLPATSTGSGASMLCPSVTCTESRCTELIVDEVADDALSDEGEHRRITLGGSGININLLNLEDRAKCDCMKGAFQCNNRARIEMTNCRHMVCFSCIEEKIEIAFHTRERPSCPLMLCANYLTRGEMNNVMWRSPKVSAMCKALENLLPQKEDMDEPGKDDIVVTSSVYGHESTIKAIIIPMHALVGDMVTACLQQQRLTKNKMTSSLGIFLRTPITNGRAMYDQIDVRELTKSVVKEQGWPQKVQLVIDVDDRLKRVKTPTGKGGQWR